MKSRKEQKEPNLKLSLATAIVFFAVITFCLIDSISSGEFGLSVYGILILIFIAACDIAIVWVIEYIIKKLHQEKAK